MGLDIRWPIGLMFSLIGAMMVVFGLYSGSDAEMYKHSLGINVNVCWGSLLLLFGLFMLIMAWRGSRKASPPAPDNPPQPGEQVQPR